MAEHETTKTQNIVHQRSTRTPNTTATVRAIFWIIYNNVQSAGRGHPRTNADVVAAVEVAAAAAAVAVAAAVVAVVMVNRPARFDSHCGHVSQLSVQRQAVCIKHCL